jgi:radical SAM protein with 4Fe4S-binding SPASM domain
MDFIKKQFKIGSLYFNNAGNEFYLDNKGDIEKDISKILHKFEVSRIPLKAKIEMTDKCNFNCYYCYNKNSSKFNELNTYEMIKLFKILENLNIMFLELTGGEPFKRKDIEYLLDYLKTKNFIVSVLTNGSLINIRHLKILEKMNSIRLFISLLAPCEKECDLLTGCKGSFKKILKTIKNLYEYKIKFSINVTLTHENIKYFKEFHDLERKIGCKFNYALDADPQLGCIENNLKYNLSDEDLLLLPNYFSGNIFSNIKMFCGAGYSQFYVSNNGDIYPCFKFKLNMGNILKNDFDSIWNNKIIIEDIQKIRERKNSIPNCTNCEYEKTCFYCPGIVYEFLTYKNGKLLPYYCLKAKKFHIYKMNNLNYNKKIGV